MVAGKVRSGKIPLLPTHQFPHWRWFRRSSSQRGLLLGIVGVLFGAIPVVWALNLVQAQPFVSSFVLFKAVWAAMLASLVTPIVGWWALAHASYLQANKNHR